MNVFRVIQLFGYQTENGCGGFCHYFRHLIPHYNHVHHHSCSHCHHHHHHHRHVSCYRSRPELYSFVVDNGDYFKVNSEIHNINTRNKLNLHPPISSLSVYQKGTHDSGIKLFNSLPSQIKDLSHNRNQFKRALKNFLYFHSFYTLDKYFSCNRI